MTTQDALTELLVRMGEGRHATVLVSEEELQGWPAEAVKAMKSQKLLVTTIRITHPNSCSLKYDELDLKLRDMLEASGIEPKEPTEGEETTEAGEAAGA